MDEQVRAVFHNPGGYRLPDDTLDCEVGCGLSGRDRHLACSRSRKKKLKKSDLATCYSCTGLNPAPHPAHPTTALRHHRHHHRHCQLLQAFAITLAGRPGPNPVTGAHFARIPVNLLEASQDGRIPDHMVLAKTLYLSVDPFM